MRRVSWDDESELIGGEEITVVTEGEDEEKAAEGIKSFFAT